MASRTAIMPFKASDDERMELLIRILEASRDLLRDKYGTRLVILYWDTNNKKGKRILERLGETDLEVVLKSSALTDKDWQKYHIPGDGHPSALAAQGLGTMLARYVEGEAVQSERNASLESND